MTNYNCLSPPKLKIDIPFVDIITSHQKVCEGLYIPFTRISFTMNNYRAKDGRLYWFNFYTDENGRFSDIGDPDCWPVGVELFAHVMAALAIHNQDKVKYWRDCRLIPYQFYEAVQAKMKFTENEGKKRPSA